MGLSAISLFSGAGGLDLAARWSGIRTVCYVEIDRYAQGVLMSRIRSGDLDDAPIWDDVTTFDGNPWRGRVDCIFGGFPCQDVSIVGQRAGIEAGERSGLWKEFARIIREVGPRFVVVENVSGLLDRGGLGYVLGDLAQLGFDARWGMHGACSVGAPHMRERVFLMAYPNGIGWRNVVENKSDGRSGVHCEVPSQWRNPPLELLLSVELVRANPKSGVRRVDDGLAEAMDALRLCGNGVVPQQALPAFQKIIELAGEMK